ncbi:hypothetical protein [Jiella sp. M17.18]|uniref:hypothetical protein n=1 Tax=Jiella sp. M17.18 TaxID=3234247 RepID=UPI0034DE00FC
MSKKWIAAAAAGGLLVASNASFAAGLVPGSSYTFYDTTPASKVQTIAPTEQPLSIDGRGTYNMPAVSAGNAARQDQRATTPASSGRAALIVPGSGYTF